MNSTILKKKRGGGGEEIKRFKYSYKVKIILEDTLRS